VKLQRAERARPKSRISCCSIRDIVVLSLSEGAAGDIVGFAAATLYASRFFRQLER